MVTLVVRNSRTTNATLIYLYIGLLGPVEKRKRIGNKIITIESPIIVVPFISGANRWAIYSLVSAIDSDVNTLIPEII